MPENNPDQTETPAITPKRKQRQPANQASKNKTALKARARKVIKALAEGDSVQAAGIKAGYAATYATPAVKRLLANPVVKDRINEVLDSVGVTDKRIAEKLNSLLDAQKSLVTKDEIRQVPDNTTQLNATQLAAKLRGHLIDRSLSVSVEVSHVDLSAYVIGDGTPDVPQDDMSIIDIESDQ